MHPMARTMVLNIPFIPEIVHLLVRKVIPDGVPGITFCPHQDELADALIFICI